MGVTKQSCPLAVAQYQLTSVAQKFMSSPSRMDATTLLGALNDKSFERDYRRSYPEAESYWGGTEKRAKSK